MNKAYNRWLTDSAVLGSKLQAYFSDTDLALGWSRLNRAVARLDAHTSSIGSDEATRIEALRDIRAALGQVEPGAAAAARVVREERVWLDRLNARGHTRLWGETQAEVIGRKDALAQRVLDSDTSAF